MRLLALLLLLALFATTVALPPEPADEPVAEHSEDEVKEAREEFESIVSSSRFFEKLSPSCAHALNYSFSRCVRCQDTNKDGYISREEILEMEEVPERDEIDEFFNTYDDNGDGRVTFDEILSADEAVRDYSLHIYSLPDLTHSPALCVSAAEKGFAR